MVDLETLKRVLRYEPQTGHFVWLEKIGYSVPGAIAGSRHNGGYWQVWIAGKQYMAHRLALFYAHGCWPSQEVDHVNGVRDDNRLSNLRAVDRSQNMQNQRAPRSNNRTGYLGVVPNRSRFAAQIKINRTTTCLGTFDTAQQAHEAYLKAKRQLHVTCAI